jgi:hypothetical protein
MKEKESQRAIAHTSHSSTTTVNAHQIHLVPVLEAGVGYYRLCKLDIRHILIVSTEQLAAPLAELLMNQPPFG